MKKNKNIGGIAFARWVEIGGKYHHVCLNYEDMAFVLYIDGALTEPVNIGEISILKTFNRVLSTKEITKHYEENREQVNRS